MQVGAMHNKAHQFQGQKLKVKVTMRINVKIKVCHIFLTRKPTNFRLGTHEARWPVSPTSAMSSKVKGQGRKVTWSVWQVLAWPIRRERKVPNPKTSKLLRRLPTSRAITRTRFEVKRSKVNISRPINAETESVSPTNFKLGRRLEHALSTAMASYKGLVKLGYCTWAGQGVYRVGRTRDGHTTCYHYYF